MLKLYVILLLLILGLTGFFLLYYPSVTHVAPAVMQTVSEQLPAVPEPVAPTSSPVTPKNVLTLADISPQLPLMNPPDIVKAIYLTSWSAGSNKKVSSTIDFMKKAGLNAVVIDIKDYSGYVAYRTGLSDVKAAGAEQDIRIARPNALVKRFHDNNIYVIARITVFQDPVLAKAHPGWALISSSTGDTWTDNKGLAWMDPAAKPVWDYVISIAKETAGRGFDEINFDYIRFASDGELGNIRYPFWDQKSPRQKVIRNFFHYLRDQLPDIKTSADLFGLVTVNHDDLGIGQVIENAYDYFDYVSPMVYPSHYASGFLGYKNPAQYPYEVIKYSLDAALTRHIAREASSTVSSTPLGKIRPWLQAFDLGAIYTEAMIRKETQAVEDSLLNVSSAQAFGGWLFWDPTNNYRNIPLE